MILTGFFTDRPLPHEQALKTIKAALHRSSVRLTESGFPATTVDGKLALLVRRPRAKAKIEVNPVVGGTVHPTRRASLTQKARDILQTDLEIPVVSLDDMYGGKLVAAIERQPPAIALTFSNFLGIKGSPRASVGLLSFT